MMFFLVSDRFIGILIGDVSGKGLGAASLAATTRSTVHAYAHETTNSGEVLTKTNSVLASEEAEFGSFVTVLLVMLDRETGRLCYASGGHPPAIIYRSDGTVKALEIGGPPLAFMSGLSYACHVDSLQPGDKLMLYTDGINEARHDAILFETEGIERILDQFGHLTPEELVDKIVKAATAWANGKLMDDAAIVMIERTAEQEHSCVQKNFSC